MRTGPLLFSLCRFFFAAIVTSTRSREGSGSSGVSNTIADGQMLGISRYLLGRRREGEADADLAVGDLARTGPCTAAARRENASPV